MRASHLRATKRLSLRSGLKKWRENVWNFRKEIRIFAMFPFHLFLSSSRIVFRCCGWKICSDSPTFIPPSSDIDYTLRKNKLFHFSCRQTTTTCVLIELFDFVFLFICRSHFRFSFIRHSQRANYSTLLLDYTTEIESTEWYTYVRHFQQSVKIHVFLCDCEIP